MRVLESVRKEEVEECRDVRGRWKRAIRYTRESVMCTCRQGPPVVAFSAVRASEDRSEGIHTQSQRDSDFTMPGFPAIEGHSCTGGYTCL